ncbi:Cellular nucleic acid-binding protein [Carex littledalei]|uniref:Cellular nucleic acid-binding protein n=1 Tax=Carex littledalei TaxID=544730 RepID=A0A833RGS8_9POAL|nr:Cellular nucleic acid-binding protein [Carex littledalei]
MGSANAIAEVLRDLHRSLEKLSVSLLPSKGPHLSSPPSHSAPSPSLPQAATVTYSHSFIPQLNPIPNRPWLPPTTGSSVPYPRPSYTDVIRADILSQPVLPRPSPSVLSKTTLRLPPAKNPVSIKLAQLRSLSDKGLPVCYKCGDQGHYTVSCRNSLICFKCKKTGHRASSCSSSQPLLKPLPPPKIPPPPPETTPSTLLQPPSFSAETLPPITMFPRPIPTPERLHEASILPPMRYYATPATSQFRNSLSQGVVLTDSRNLGAQYIQAHLHRLFPIPRWTWIARELPNNQYLIAPPDLEWRNTVLREHQLLLSDIPFPVQAYEFTRFNNRQSLKNYWVQIYDYPHDLWRKPELSQLARDLGGILVDTDPRSLEHTSLAHTRIKIAVPDKEVIPACRNLIFTDTNGEINLPEPPPLAPIPTAPTDIAPPLARPIPPTSQPLTILPPSDVLLPNPTAPPLILLDHPPKPPVLESPLPHLDPLPDGPPTLEAPAPVQLTEPDVVPALETVPPPETLIASAEIPSEIPAALDPTPATVTVANPTPSQDRGKGQPTASEEARHYLCLKVKEGTTKKRGGKSGASSEGSDLSDLLRDRAAAFFHSSNLTTHTSSSSAS